MACCPKCGKTKLRKDALKRRHCKRCGILPNETQMDRLGNPSDDAIETIIDLHVLIENQLKQPVGAI